MADKMADSSTKEQVSACIRYIRRNRLHQLEVRMYVKNSLDFVQFPM